MRKFLVMGGLLLVLSGCGASFEQLGSTLVQYNPDGSKVVSESSVVSLARAQEESVQKCLDNERNKPKADCTGLSDMACLMLKMQEQNVQLVAVATGNTKSACYQENNLFSVLETEVIQKNETVRSVTGNAVSAVKWLGAAWFAKDAVDSIGKNSGQTQNIQGNSGDVQASPSRTSSEVNNDETATAVGSDSPATTSGSGGGASIPGITPVSPATDVVPTTPTVE